MESNQLIQIAVAELAHTQSPAHAVLVLLVQLQHVNVLVNVVVNFPSDSKMVSTLRRRTNDTVAALDVGLRKLGFGLV